MLNALYTTAMSISRNGARGVTTASNFDTLGRCPGCSIWCTGSDNGLESALYTVHS